MAGRPSVLLNGLLQFVQRRQRYREDAFARLRTLFEFALDLRYLRKDPGQTSELAEWWLDSGTLMRGGAWLI
jgi:hypothetical protein